jgi:hypothetical protein
VIIKDSLEWAKLETTLKNKTKNLIYRKDVSRMIENINQEIKQLSIAEISARRGHRHLADELLVKINQDIEMVEEYILVATLLG